MDRISKALELAQSERRPQRARGARRPQRERPEIVYTTTRTVGLSQHHLRQRRVLCGGEDDAVVVDQYRLLRTRVLQRMVQNGWRTLGITSPASKEGKTLTSINLAVSIAREMTHTVLLVDADLRRPSVADALGLDGEPGLGEYLSDDVPLENLLIHPGIDRLVVLPGGRASANASELMASDKMKDLVQDVRDRYESRIVLFDLPPVLVGDDVVGLAPRLDACLLVIEEGKSDSREVAAAAELLEDVDWVGAVLNKAQEMGTRYEYAYE